LGVRLDFGNEKRASRRKPDVGATIEHSEKVEALATATPTSGLRLDARPNPEVHSTFFFLTQIRGEIIPRPTIDHCWGTLRKVVPTSGDKRPGRLLVAAVTCAIQSRRNPIPGSRLPCRPPGVSQRPGG